MTEKDKTTVTSSTKNGLEGIPTLSASFNAPAMKPLPRRLKQDRDLILAAVNPIQSLKNDPDIVIAAVQKIPNPLQKR